MTDKRQNSVKNKTKFFKDFFLWDFIFSTQGIKYVKFLKSWQNDRSSAFEILSKKSLIFNFDFGNFIHHKIAFFLPRIQSKEKFLSIFF